MTNHYSQEKIKHPDHPGFGLQVRLYFDEDRGNPWEGDDNHGPVRADHDDFNYGTGKAPGEVEIHYNDGASYFYDVQAATKRARKEGWGLSPKADLDLRLSLVRATMSQGLRNLLTMADVKARAACVTPTKGQIAAEAVRLDMLDLSRWLRSDWHWAGVTVTVSSAPPEYGHMMEDQDEFEHALWGLRSDDTEHILETAVELGGEIIRGMQARLLKEQNAEADRAALVGHVIRRLLEVHSGRDFDLCVALDAKVIDGWTQAWVRVPDAVKEN